MSLTETDPTANSEIRTDRILAVFDPTASRLLSEMENGKSVKEAVLLLGGEEDPAVRGALTGETAKNAFIHFLEQGFGITVPAAEIYTEGIASVTKEDFRVAADLDCKLLLTALLEAQGEKLYLRVSPLLVPKSSPLAALAPNECGVLVRADSGKEILFRLFQNGSSLPVCPRECLPPLASDAIGVFPDMLAQSLFLFRGCAHLAMTVSGVFGGGEALIFEELDAVGTVSAPMYESTVGEMLSVCPFTFLRRLYVSENPFQE